MKLKFQLIYLILISFPFLIASQDESLDPEDGNYVNVVNTSCMRLCLCEDKISKAEDIDYNVSISKTLDAIEIHFELETLQISYFEINNQSWPENSLQKNNRSIVFSQLSNDEIYEIFIEFELLDDITTSSTEDITRNVTIKTCTAIQIPGKPIHFDFEPNLTPSGEIFLSWVQPENVSSKRLTHLRYYLTGETLEKLETKILDGNTTEVSFDGLKPGENYVFTIYAFYNKTIGDGGYQKGELATLKVDHYQMEFIIPGPVESCKINDVSSTFIELVWNPPPNIPEKFIESYSIWTYQLKEEGTNQLKECNGSEHPINDSTIYTKKATVKVPKLTPNTCYFFKIQSKSVFEKDGVIFKTKATRTSAEIPPSSNQLGAIIGGTIGGLVVICLIVVLVIFAFKRNLITFCGSKKEVEGENANDNAGYQNGSELQERTATSRPEYNRSENVAVNITPSASKQENIIQKNSTVDINDITTIANDNDIGLLENLYKDLITRSKKCNAEIINPMESGKAKPMSRQLGGFNSDVCEYLVSNLPFFNENNEDERMKLVWNDIWEKNVSVIVMLTNIKEHSELMCHRYWPEKLLKEEKLTLIDGKNIDLIKTVEEKNNGYIERKFQMKKGNHKRIINHFQFTNWEKKACPAIKEELLDLIENMRRPFTNKNNSMGPIFVHCSGAFDRTEQFIATDYCIENIKGGEKEININDQIIKMRKLIPFSIREKRQYTNIYECVSEYMSPNRHGNHRESRCGNDGYDAGTGSNIYAEADSTRPSKPLPIPPPFGTGQKKKRPLPNTPTEQQNPEEYMM